MTSIDRRSFLAGAAIACAAMPAFAGGSRRPAAEAIDVHHHLFAPSYVAAKRSLLLSPGYEDRVLNWSPAVSLAQMDAAGVRKAIVSVTTPGVWFGDSREALALSRDCNDYAADMTRQYPGRFGYFATLPLPDTAGSIAEAVRALDSLGAQGIGLMTNYDGRYLGDPLFSPVLAELDRRSAIVFVHPMAAACCRNLVPELPTSYLELPFDTTRTIASLLYSGAFARFRRIRFIFSHGGGTIPMLANRLALWARLNPNLARRVAPGGVAAQLASQYYDTVGVTNPPAFAALRNFAPIDQLLFGSDYPYLGVDEQRASFDAMHLARDEGRKILSANFERLAPSS